MSEENKLFLDHIKDSARSLVHAGQDVRSQLHALTVSALNKGQLAKQEIREVLEAITEGVSLGATQRAEELRIALGEALSGVDDALANAAEDMQQALSETGSHTREFSNGELHQELDHLKQLKQLFVETVIRVAGSATGLVKQELSVLAERAHEAGSSSGEQVKAVAEKLTSQLRATAHEAGDASKLAAIEISARVANMTSSKLAEIAARMQRKADALKQDK